MTNTIVAPTDSQLGYIASLCREWGWQRPTAVHSKREASEIIAAMQDGSYSPELPDWRETDEAGRGAGGTREASEGEE